VIILSNQFLFVQDISRLAPKGYIYGEENQKDLQMARNAFTNRGIDVSKLDIYTFDVYYPERGGMIIAFAAGKKIDRNERGGWIEECTRSIAKDNSEDLHDEDPAHLVNRINNYLIANGAIATGTSTKDDDGHWKTVEKTRLEEPSTLDENSAYYGMVLNITH
jgi:hypothetical protein